jgi:hypothetical protein
LQVQGDAFERLVGGVGLDDGLVGAGQEDDGVDGGEQQRVDQQLGRDLREDGGAVGHLGFFPPSPRCGRGGRGVRGSIGHVSLRRRRG